MTLDTIKPGTSGLAQNLSARKNVLDKSLNILKHLQTAKCEVNQY